MNHVGPGATPPTLDQAMALFEGGRPAEAETAFRAILAADPENAEALAQLGGVLAAGQRLAEAEQVWTAALRLRPESPDLLYNLALLHQLAGRHDAAIERYRRIVALQAASSDVLLNLGNSYLALQRTKDAIAAYREAVRLAPGSALALTNLGRALAGAGQRDEAAATFRRAIQAAPDAADPLVALAQLQLAGGLLAEPGDLLARALRLQPGFTEARRALAQIHELTGNIDAAIAERRQALAAEPQRADLHRELILALNFAEADDGARVADACRDWHRRFATSLTPAGVPARRNRNPDRPLRVGYVGGTQFRRHTLAPTVLPLIEAHSAAVEFTCYSDLRPDDEDDISARFQRRMTWRRTGDLTDEDYARTIAADGIDVIIDPLGFVGGSRLLALARRPAPVQVSFPVMGTCGGAAIDYVLADDRILPAGAERYYAERPLRIPFAYCYRPLDEPPAVVPPPALASGTVTFGSMNSLPKISGSAIRAWQRILDRVPHSRLMVKAGFPFRDDEVRRRFLHRLESAGIDPRRVVLKEWVATHADHLAAYNEIDVALDSLPYNGVVTTYEALLMGVPVVTLTGARSLDRYATSILTSVGFAEGIAADEDAYVAQAVSLASDVSRLAALRGSLRGRLLASPACDAGLVARSIEAALRTAWRDYCVRDH